MEKYPRLKRLIEDGLVWLDGEIYCMIDDDDNEIIVGWIHDLEEAESHLAYLENV